MESKAARLTFFGTCLALAIVSLFMAQRGLVQRQSFKAFYCAGAAIDAGANPYLVEPLRTCERSLLGSAQPPGYVEPAPLPGYALAGFAAIAKLPPKSAALVFALTLALAAMLSAHCLSQCVPLSRAAILLALAPLTLLNVAYGEIPPLALLALCASAWLLVRGRGFAAGIAVTLALVEPNVGLPAVIAVFAFAPRTRIAIAASVCVLGLLSAAAIGIQANFQYLSVVLPLMSRAELGAADQYSLPHLLHAAGISSSAALFAGKIWFAIALCGSVALAGILAIRRRHVELLPLLPPAAILLFGIYLHDIQFIFAVPAALLVAYHLRASALLPIAALSAALLVAVWTQRLDRMWLLLDAVGVAAAVYALLPGPSRRRATFALSAAGAVVACAAVMQRIAPPVTSLQIVTANFTSAAHEQAALAWGRYLQATPALLANTLGSKVPSWLGLIGLLYCAFRLSATPIRSESHEPLPAIEPYNESSRRYG